MLNTIKMDLYRMFKTKSLYVIWVILAALTLFSTALCKDEYSDASIQAANYEEQLNTEDSVPNIGMTVIIPTVPGEKVSLYDMIFANFQGKSIATLLVIFSILFCNQDLSSGYIKNIGGQIEKRSFLILSKTICLALYTILTMIFFFIIQAMANGIFFGYLKLGNLETLALYFLTQVLLHLALVLITGGIAIVLRNNVISMAIGMCLCMNVIILFYNFIDKLMEKAGAASFHLIDYTVTGKISMLPINLSRHDSITAIMTAIAFSIVSVAGCNFIFTKRDIS